MTYTITTTTPYLISTSNKVHNTISGKAVTSRFTVLSDDLSSFMNIFTFPDLKEVRNSLEESSYSEEFIDEIIKGLKTIPGHKRD